MRSESRLLLSIMLFLTAVPVRSQGAPAELTRAVGRLQTAVATMDFGGGLRESNLLVRQFPSSPELQAWRIVLMQNAGFGPESQDAADSLARHYPGSSWSAFAQGFLAAQTPRSLHRALQFANRALAADPRNEDFIRLKAVALTQLGDAKEAERFLDARMADGLRSAGLLATKGHVMLAQASQRLPIPDSSAVDRALVVFAEARQLDSTLVSAYTFDIEGYRVATGWIALNAAKRPEALAPYWRRARALAPFALDFRRAAWFRVLDDSSRTIVEKRAEIESDIDRMLQARSDDPGTLALAAWGYGRLLQKPSQRRDLEERLLQEFPASDPAEQLWVDRLTILCDSLAGAKADTARINAEFFRRIREFIARPVHVSRSRLGMVYSWALGGSGVVRQVGAFDSTLTADTAVLFAHAAVRADPSKAEWTVFPIALADRKVDLQFAERLAWQADTMHRLEIENTARFYSTAKALATARNEATAETHDVLGWIWFSGGRVAAARQELTKAVRLDPDSRNARYHMGRLLEAQGNVAAAQRSYANGVESERTWTGSHNGDALKRLYKARHHGSLAGFAAYLATAREVGRGRHKAAILASRVASPKAMPPLDMARLGGGRVTSADLAGKIVVLSVGGVWCAPCVAESPFIQKFYEKYRGDSSVVFLAVDTRDDPAVVTKFMATRKFTYPVLLDSGWVDTKARIGAFPTTWFVDRLGRVAFVDRGSDDNLVDEFSWRVEALRAERPKPRR